MNFFLFYVILLTMKENSRNKVLPLILSVAVIILDQLTKCLVVKYIPRLTLWTDDGIIEILGKYVRLIHVRNNAIAFSMGSTLSQNARGLLFALMPLLIIIAVYVIYFRNNEFTKLQRWSICGILGGGIGAVYHIFYSYYQEHHKLFGVYYLSVEHYTYQDFQLQNTYLLFA